MMMLLTAWAVRRFHAPPEDDTPLRLGQRC
jgi:hypothetical protein